MADNIYQKPAFMRSIYDRQFLEYRGVFLFFALVLYALWGAPTPNNPGITEVFIAVSIFVAVGFVPIVQNVFFSWSYKMALWQLSCIVLFLYGITVPLITSLGHAVSITHVVRDIIGFLFLCLPLFFIYVLRSKYFPLFWYGVLLIGIVFSLRVLFPSVPFFNHNEELLYLANSPLVIFTALFLTGMALQQLYNENVVRAFFPIIVTISLAYLLFSAMFIDVQRAVFGALFMTVISLCVIGTIRAPLRMILPLVVISLLAVLMFSYWQGISDLMVRKTSTVGFNMRFQELQAVWDAVSHDSYSMIFGLGWGVRFESPAVGGLEVTFTHSLLSYMFLKTGLIGLGLTLIYLFFIFEKSVRLYLIDPVRGNAVIWSLFIPIILYASYKSFDFGLLLTLIIILADRVDTMPEKERSLINE